MTDQERQDIKARLIELGVWGADETGDPLTDKEYAQVVKSRLVERLADGVLLASRGYLGGTRARHIEVQRGEFNYEIAHGDNEPEAVCLAALALPEFLKQHPECAADQK